MTPLSAPSALIYCVINWLIPGGGFLAAGMKRRGWILFALLNGCFLLGLAMDGTVDVPELNRSSETFNIVAVLTFVVKLCHGGGSLVLLVLQKAGLDLTLLLRNPATAIADLGTFHLIVAGALNYFATARLYDLLVGYQDPAAVGVEASHADAAAPVATEPAP